MSNVTPIPSHSTVPQSPDPSHADIVSFMIPAISPMVDTPSPTSFPPWNTFKVVPVILAVGLTKPETKFKNFVAEQKIVFSSPGSVPKKYCSALFHTYSPASVLVRPVINVPPPMSRLTAPTPNNGSPRPRPMVKIEMPRIVLNPALFKSPASVFPDSAHPPSSAKTTPAFPAVKINAPKRRRTAKIRTYALVWAFPECPFDIKI